jgi:hypothetical protein
MNKSEQGAPTHYIFRSENDYLKSRNPVRIGRVRTLPAMCQSCVEIDKRIDKFRALLRRTTDPAEIERINRQIIYLYGERLRLHRNEES